MARSAFNGAELSSFCLDCMLCIILCGVLRPALHECRSRDAQSRLWFNIKTGINALFLEQPSVIPRVPTVLLCIFRRAETA